MSAPRNTSDLAFRAAELLRAEPPWDLVGERARRFELHFQGREIELERGPITIEGYGVRLIRPRDGRLGVGFQASTDLSREGVAAAAELAATVSRHAEFPAKTVELPDGRPAGAAVDVVDPALWADPLGALRGYASDLLGAFEGRRGVVPSFGSVKAILSEVSLANSAGLRVAFATTRVDLELAVKAFGGAEGAPPGEFWVNESQRRLESARTRGKVDDWCRYAEDARRASAPPTGEVPVVLPPEVLSGILPPVIGSRFSGAFRLRKLAPELGSRVGNERVTIRDQGDFPWSPASAPYDDEGTPRGRQPLIDRGAVTGYFYDALYASAFATRSTGNGRRSSVGPTGWMRFAHTPGPDASTLVMDPGDGGTTQELVEAAGDGILVTQLGWAFPDMMSGAFGGEIRIGYRIRGGKLAEPIRGGTVGGVALSGPEAPSMLTNLVAVGREAALSDNLVAPPVLVRPLTVAGASA